MSPVIKVNDLLHLESFGNELKQFDIILFKRNSVLVAHYVWKNQISFNNTIVTRSLSNIYEDEEPVDLIEIIGKISNFKIPTYLRFKILIFCFLKGKF